MNTKNHNSRWSIGIGILLLMALFPWADVQADYLYAMKLRNVDNSSESWTNWIHVTKEDKNDGWGEHWHNSLRDYIENRKEVYDNLGNQISCRYRDGYGNVKWCDNADESSFANQIQYNVVAIKFKRGNDAVGSKGEYYEILEGDDYFYMQDGNEIEIFNRIKDEVLTLDLSEWEKAFLGTSRTELHYFGEMIAMRKLVLPTNHEFAIGNEYLFANAYNLEEIEWGANSKIVEVGKGAFYNCFKLSQATIQRILDEVGEYSSEGAIGSRAFYNCVQLQEVTIPARIRWIGDEAFCQRVVIPSDLPIGYNTGIITPSLKKVTFLSDAEKTGSNEYWKSYWDNYEQHWSEDFKWSGLQIDYLGNMCFAECQLMEDIVLNDAQLKKLGYGVFADCRLLGDDDVQAVLDNYATYGQQDGSVQIPAALFWGVNGKKLDGTYDKRFTTLTVPANVSSIGAAAFAIDARYDEPSIKTINVSRGWRPDCQNSFADNTYYDGFTSFAGIVPNHVTVNFSGDAAKYSSSTSDLVGYTHYQNDGSEWQRLLTKDIYATPTAATYDVEPQQHAIVRLHRTMNSGWNSFCLPFGATAAAKEIPVKVEGEPSANSRIVKDALNANNGDGFMIALYRDYVDNSNTFRFLRIDNYDTTPIPAYQPFLVKMTDSDISTANATFVFNNVDVNYQWNPAAGETNTGYSTDNVTITEPASTQPQAFGGQAEDFVPFNDGKGSLRNYAMTGTFNTLKGTVGQNDGLDGFVTTNDYFMQNTDGTVAFYPYTDGMKAGILAFTAWFHHTGSGAAKPMSILMGLHDDLRIVIDDEEIEEPIVDSIATLPATAIDKSDAAVYTLSGQRVMASCLAPGIYIVNGKKTIIR